MNTAILEEALIPEEWHEFCYISEDIIYTPLFDKDGSMLKAGEEVYREVNSCK